MSLPQFLNRTHRLALGVANPAVKEGDQLRAQDQPMEGQGSEAFLHGPLLTGRLVRVQAGVRSVSVMDLTPCVTSFIYPSSQKSSCFGSLQNSPEHFRDSC